MKLGLKHKGIETHEYVCRSFTRPGPRIFRNHVYVCAFLTAPPMVNMMAVSYTAYSYAPLADQYYLATSE